MSNPKNSSGFRPEVELLLHALATAAPTYEEFRYYPSENIGAVYFDGPVLEDMLEAAKGHGDVYADISLMKLRRQRGA